MDNRQIIQAYFDRMNSEDWEGLGDLFDEDAVLEAPGFPRQRGRETVRGYFRAALGIYPKHYDDPVRIVVAGDTVTVNIHYEGTLANGHQLSFDAVDVFDLRDGKIVEQTSWYDSHMVRQALLEAREQTRDPRATARGCGWRWPARAATLTCSAASGATPDRTARSACRP